MGSIDLDDRRLDQIRFLGVYSRLAQVQLGTLTNAYDYHAIRRLIAVDGDDVEAEGDDPLAEIIVDGIKALPGTEREGTSELSVDPPASMAALFQQHALARSLKPKLFVAFDLRAARATVCGMLSACTFARDDALSTTRFAPAYCTTHGLPRFDANWMLVDVVAASKRGTGALLLLQCIVHAARAKKTGIVSVAVTKGGRRLFEACGFDTSHTWRERSSARHLCYARITDIHLADLHARLRVHSSLLTDVCFRNGLTSRTMHNLVGRC